MSKVKFVLATAVAFGFLSIFSLEALPDEIKFNVNVSSEFRGQNSSLVCLGPFGRSGSTKFIPGDSKNFYNAEINIFSPFGDWTCCLRRTVFPLNCTGFDTNVKFCIGPTAPPSPLSATLNVDQNGELVASFFGSPFCPGTTGLASLGDDSKFRRPDRDTFSIEATEGDELVVTLEADGSTGHTGTDATLTFRDAIPGLSLEESTSGPLPLELRPVAPATGKYEIVIDHRGFSEDTRYRGGYIISVKGLSNDENQVIAPGEDVEQ